ncbi:MAG: hypothetical protein RR604_08565, partial [Eubacterium sp.]
ALEKVSYPTKDVEKKDVTVDVAVKDNTIDLSKIDPTLLKTPDLTLAFNLLAFGEDGIKRGDTFVLNLPKNAEDKPFFILTDTAIDQPLIAGKDDKAVQIGAYTIKNNVLTATFDGAAEGLADDNRNGEISLKTALNATLLSADTPTKVDFNLQNVKVDDALKVTEADVTTATRTVLLPKKTPKESAKDENSKNPAEPTPEAEKPSEPSEPTTSVAPKKTENETDVKKPVDGDKKSNGLLTSLFNRGSKKATPATDALGNTPADMTSTKKKLTKIPEGFSEITLQTQGKTAGYKKDDADLDMKFGIQMKLSDDYLLLKLEEYQNSLVGFPQFDGGDTQAYNQYLEKVDAFLEASSDVKPLTFTYTLGKDFTIDNRTTTRPDTKEYPLIVGTEKIGECVVTKDAQGVCSVTVKFDKKIYNRYAVSASQSLDLQVDKTALKDAEPVYVGFED